MKLPESDVRRIRGNRSDFVRKAVSEKLQREAAAPWKPKTAAVKRMLKLREQFLAEGGQTLNAAGISAELESRRGGLKTHVQG